MYNPPPPPPSSASSSPLVLFERSHRHKSDRRHPLLRTDPPPPRRRRDSLRDATRGTTHQLHWHSNLSCVGGADVVYRDLRDACEPGFAGDTARYPCKNDSAMWDSYNTYTNGHGGCCALWAGDGSPCVYTRAPSSLSSSALARAPLSRPRVLGRGALILSLPACRSPADTGGHDTRASLARTRVGSRGAHLEPAGVAHPPARGVTTRRAAAAAASSRSPPAAAAAIHAPALRRRRYGPMGDYFCGNSSAGGWVGYDDPRGADAAAGLSPALPTGFDFDAARDMCCGFYTPARMDGVRSHRAAGGKLNMCHGPSVSLQAAVDPAIARVANFSGGVLRAWRSGQASGGWHMRGGGIG